MGLVQASYTHHLLTLPPHRHLSPMYLGRAFPALLWDLLMLSPEQFPALVSLLPHNPLVNPVS